MAVSRLADIPGCPDVTLEDLRRAHSEGLAFLAVDRSFSMGWIDLRGANPSRAETIFHFTLSWAMSWAGLLMAALAWRSLGPKALLLVLVSLVAGFCCRPWRGYLTWLVALALLIFSKGLPSWAGGTWLLTAFLISGWIEWCGDRLQERLLQDEVLLALALQPGGLHERPVAVIKSGK